MEPKSRVSRKIVSSYASSSPTEDKDSRPRREAVFKTPPGRDNKEK